MFFPALIHVMADGGGDALGGIGINAFLVVAQIINFIILILILNGVLLKPLMRGLENRRLRIEESLENARKADERMANIEHDYQARLQAAQAEAEHIKEQARIDALAERHQMLSHLRSQVAALVLAAAGKPGGVPLDAQRQQALIDDYFARLPAHLLDGVAFASPASVSVTSALPLSPDEQAQVKSDLALQVGPLGEISFAVDPGILGGLVVRVGDKVVDGSVAGKLTAMRQALNA